MNNLSRIDLNLLVTLHALLVERHISRTALRLHKSQPAISHALAHLRDLFDDPLLIRRGGRLELTPRANELMPALTQILDQVGTLLAPPPFDPVRTQRIFHLAMSDYGARVVLPSLVRTLRLQAPGVDLVVTQAGREAMALAAIEGETDLALGVFPRLPDPLRRQTLFVDRFACLADASSYAEVSLDIDAWLQRPHALVSMRAGMDNEVDRALAALGRQRHLTLVLPHWGVANDLIAGTDLILTVARRNLDSTQQDARLRVFEPPFPIAPFAFEQVWHPRRDVDPAHRWLRQLVAGVAAGA